MTLASPPLKKLINAVDDFVTEELQGMEAAHPDLVRIDYDNSVVLRAHRSSC